MHLALPQATFSIEIKFLLHMCNFLLRLSSCLTASLHHLLPVSLHLPSFRSSLISISFLLPLTPPLSFLSAGRPPVTADTCFPSANLPLTAAELIWANYFSSHVNNHYWPLAERETERDRERERERGCKMSQCTVGVFQVSSTIQPSWKVWPQFHKRREHFHAASITKTQSFRFFQQREKTPATHVVAASEKKLKSLVHITTELKIHSKKKKKTDPTCSVFANSFDV